MAPGLLIHHLYFRYRAVIGGLHGLQLRLQFAQLEARLAIVNLGEQFSRLDGIALADAERHDPPGRFAADGDQVGGNTGVVSRDM